MPQPGSDSPRSPSPTDSVVFTPQTASEAFLSSFPDTDSTADTPRHGTDEPTDTSPSTTESGLVPAVVRDPLDGIEALRMSLDRPLRAEVPPALDPARDALGSVTRECGPIKSKAPFHKWVRKLHRRHLQRQKVLGADIDMPAYEKGPAVGREGREDRDDYRRSSSDSSFAFVTTARSTSVSLASVSASIAGRSKKNTVRSSRAYSRTDGSSRASVSGARLSEDGQFADGVVPLDPAVGERATRRRKILEELISTEEGYIGDVKFLMNVYVTILASLPTSQSGLRPSINRNLTDIIELHEEILGELHQVVPDSEHSQDEAPPASPTTMQRPHHQKWRSLDAVPENKDGMSWLQQVPGLSSDPQTAADVAQVFAKRVNRFFVYEEYGAKYESMIKDVAIIHRAMPEWDKYQKGLEALAASLGSANGSEDQSRRALTVGDLLVKRMCKYPLLFAELLKHTPVCDCPYSYMEIESALIRLREATGAINRATDNDRTKATLEKSWLLQDRLVFPDQGLDAASRSRIRAFGHVQLCGVLHVCWQTKDGVRGSYMICLLYRECLCLASAGKPDQIYTIQACLALSSINVEDVDNGRGLQCHTAPFSWKLVFECDHQLFEIIMTACTPKEEVEWRSRLSHSPSSDIHLPVDPPLFSSLALNVKALGAVYGKPGTVARRISIHRATTVGPKSPLYQVILKNTSVEREAAVSASKSSINRSQSLLTTNARIPVLAPSRGDRARLEALLSDVWTRGVLPFPGITVRARSEHLVRSSASSVMRKLSVASIASSFTKRSSSNASMHMTSSGNEPAASLDAPRVPPRGASFLTAEETAKSRLSVISDEAGRGGATTPVAAAPPPPGEAVELRGTLRRVEALKLETEWAPDDRGDGFSLLRAASFDSLRSRARRSSRSSKKAAKEGTGPPSSQETCVASSIKSTGRWGRVGIIQRAVMVEGIRGFFR